jgi:regulatory protein
VDAEDDVDTVAVERAREAALTLLDRSRKTRSQLERRLAEKGFAAPIAAAALDRLAQVGLVDDVEYAQAFVRSKLSRSSVGLRVLENQLRARGVAAADRARVLAGLDGGAGERARAERALAPLLRRYRGLEPGEARARATSALLRRGFDYATARDVLAALSGALPVADPAESDRD